MIQISPAWIISFLPDDKHKAFFDVVDKQFKAFTEIDLGQIITEEKEYSKWWGIDNGNDASTLSIESVPKSLKQAYPLDTNATFLQNSMTVIVYGIISDNYVNKLDAIINDIKASLPLQFSITYYYILFGIKKNTDLKSIDSFFRRNSFDAIILQSECNLDGQNESGYLTLLNTTDVNDYSKIFGSAAQIILNLAIGHSTLKSNVSDTSNMFAAGGFSITYENDVYKSQLAKKFLTIPILENFLNNKSDKEWKNVHVAPNGFYDQLKGFDAGIFYDQAILSFDDKAKEVKHFFTHSVSPWSILSSLLIPRYFGHELKSMLQHLVEYGRLLDIKLLSMFRSHLINNLFNEKGLSTSSEVKLQSMAISLWTEWNIDDKSPVGIHQYIHNLSLIKEKLIGVRNTLIDDNEFEKIFSANEPIKVPDIIYKEYKKITTTYYHGTSPGDLSEAETDKEGAEAGFIKELKDKLLFHPIPLSLIIRASLLGFVLSITTFSAIRVIPDSILNTSWFEKGDGIYVWLASAFIVPLIIAFIHYVILTLLKIRRLKLKYLAWVFSRIQRKLIQEARIKVNSLVDMLIDKCNQLEYSMEYFIVPFSDNSSEERLEINKGIPVVDISKLECVICTKQFKYPTGYFQQSIFEPIDGNANKFFAENIKEYNFSIEFLNGPINSRNILEQEQIYRIFCDFFNSNKHYKEFFTKALVNKTMTLEDFANMLQKHLEGILNSSICSIDEFKITKDAVDTIKSRSYPSYFNYAKDNVTKFRFSIALEGHLPSVLSEFMDTKPDELTTILPIYSSPSDDTNRVGIRQYCQFYRLSGLKNQDNH